MKNTVLAFSGGIATGKSTLSQAVAMSLGCPRVSFGSYMRAEATRRGLPDDRKTLQDIGKELVARDPEGLCRGVLAQAGWIPGGALVVDGVRHVEIAGLLRRLVSPSEFRLVHVSASDSARLKRLAFRGENAGDLQVLDAHSTERDVRDRLRELSDLRVDGERPLEVVIEEVSRWAVTLP
jgi:dephospho-CoA kinase